MGLISGYCFFCKVNTSILSAFSKFKIKCVKHLFNKTVYSFECFDHLDCADFLLCVVSFCKELLVVEISNRKRNSCVLQNSSTRAPQAATRNCQLLDAEISFCTRVIIFGLYCTKLETFNLKSNFTCNMCIYEFTIVHATQTGYTECHGETNLSVKCTSRS